MLKSIITKDEFKTGLSIVLFVAVLTGLFATLDFYMTNKDYFFFDGSDVVPFAMLFTVVIFLGGLIVVSILSCLNKKLVVVLEGIVLGVFTALYIIGNYMVVDYGAMDGLIVHWEQYRTEGIIQVSCFCIVVLAMVSIAIVANTKKSLAIFRYISLGLTGVLLFTLLVSMAMIGLKKDAEYIVTKDKMFELSNEGNLIVLILDTFDSGIFADMLVEDYDKYSDIMEDFVYYPDTTSMYAATDLALPHIVTGVKYYNDQVYGEYLKKAYKQSILLKETKEKNYSFGLYTTCRLPQQEEMLLAENVKYMKRTVSSHKKLAKYMYMFVGFRYLPQPLKQYCWFYPEEMRSEIECTVDDSIELFEANNYTFYEGITDIENVEKNQCIRLFHIDGTHAPFSINSDFSPSNGETSIEEEGRGMLVLVEHFLEELKSKGLYDNSAIIIMADHGYYDKRANALLMVKGVNEKHTFEVSDMPVSFDYLQDAMLKLLDGEMGTMIFEQRVMNADNRTYLHYSWNKDLRDDSYADIITEYMVTGVANNEDNYTIVGHYSADE